MSLLAFRISHSYCRHVRPLFRGVVIRDIYVQIDVQLELLYKIGSPT
jgi:hypothetical protein